MVDARFRDTATHDVGREHEADDEPGAADVEGIGHESGDQNAGDARHRRHQLRTGEDTDAPEYRLPQAVERMSGTSGVLGHCGSSSGSPETRWPSRAACCHGSAPYESSRS